MAMQGLIQRYVGCLTVLSDAATVEEIMDEAGRLYIRLTMCDDDEGMSQSTWEEKNAPAVVMKLLVRLEELDSHITEDGMLVGPHIMRGGVNRDILKINGGRSTSFELFEDENADLVWLDNLLHITRDSDDSDGEE